MLIKMVQSRSLLRPSSIVQVDTMILVAFTQRGPTALALEREFPGT